MRDCARRIALPLVLVLVTGNRQGLADDPKSGGRTTTAPRVVLVSAGTLVDAQPPATWSHLVIKSLPRLTSGDLQTLPRPAFRTASLFRTVILADVGRSAENPGTFAIRRVGIGLCVPNQEGKDVVVQSGRLEEAGISLGMMEKIVFKTAEAELLRGRMIAATPTFVLYRGPTVLLGQSGHRKVMLYYALMVGRASGALRTFVWARGDHAAASTEVVELGPNLVYDCRLNVEAQRVLGAVPVSWSFAMESLPPGRSRTVLSDLSRVVSHSGAGAPDSSTIEKHLRQILMGNSGSARLTATEP
jgi:hypothetical protein